MHFTDVICGLSEQGEASWQGQRIRNQFFPRLWTQIPKNCRNRGLLLASFGHRIKDIYISLTQHLRVVGPCLLLSANEKTASKSPLAYNGFPSFNPPIL